MAVNHNDGQTEQEFGESYEHLLEDYSHFAPPASDEVLQGTVLSVTGKDVIIDFGYKSEGIVPIEQFQSHSGEITVQTGDVVDVMIDHGAVTFGKLVRSSCCVSHALVHSLLRIFACTLQLPACPFTLSRMLRICCLACAHIPAQ